MFPIKAGTREIVIQEVSVETVESVEMILHPLPCVTKHVIETCLGGWVVVHRLDRGEIERENVRLKKEKFSI